MNRKDFGELPITAASALLLPVQGTARKTASPDCTQQEHKTTMKFLSIILCLFVITLNISAAFGQDSAVIKGIVTDPNGAVVSGATVTISDQTGTKRRTSVTDAAGTFSFDGLPTGSYRLTVEKTGFAVLMQTVMSGAGELSLKLQVSGVGASVNVEGETYVAKESVTATKTDTPLMETPFTVQVMPQQVIVDVGQQQDIGKAASLLGIPTQGFDNYTATFFYRGFLSSGTLWNGFRIDEITTTAGPGNGPVWMDN